MSSEPVPVIPLEYEQPYARPRRVATPANILLMVAWVVCACGWVAVVTVDVESVLLSAPLIAALGVTLGVVGLLARRGVLAAVGAAHVGTCLLCFALVLWRSWSPGEARMPFVFLGGAHVALSGLASAWLILAHGRRSRPAIRNVNASYPSGCK